MKHSYILSLEISLLILNNSFITVLNKELSLTLLKKSFAVTTDWQNDEVK